MPGPGRRPAPGTPLRPRSPVGRAGIAGWLMFDWATQPFFTLITTFVYAPFFAGAIALDPVAGQAQWGYATAAAGLVVAVLSPPLGAVADAAGGRKPWIAAFSALLVAGSGLLWFAVPGTGGAVTLALLGFVLGTIGVEFATVFNNAMMPDLVDRGRLGRLSGSGWALGYAGGLVSLVLVLGLMAGDPATGVTVLGIEPLFGLDPATRQGDRAAGPFTALWYLVFVLPLFLFTPDVARRQSLGRAVRGGMGDLISTLRRLPADRPVLAFLLANMIYKDGLAALFVFGGIFAVGVFGWTTLEIGLFGILLTVTGVFGALLGGVLDDRFGPRAVVAGALLVLILASIGILSIDRATILFVVAVPARAATAGLFASPAEIAYLVLGGIIGAAAGPLQACSRTLLVALSPPDRITAFFGLFALSGKVTSFAAPVLVAVVTGWAGSQRLGIAVIVVFFVAGLWLLRRVAVEPR